MIALRKFIETDRTILEWFDINKFVCETKSCYSNSYLKHFHAYSTIPV